MKNSNSFVLTTIIGSYSFVVTNTKGIEYSGYVYITQHAAATSSGNRPINESMRLETKYTYSSVPFERHEEY